MVGWYVGGGAFLLSGALAVAGLALLVPAAVSGVWRAEFTPRARRALAWGGVLLLEAALNVFLWAVATDHDNAEHGVPWGVLAALAALMLAAPVAAAVWSRQRPSESAVRRDRPATARGLPNVASSTKQPRS